jgi:F0F1-type ATP synthase assembly protein I
MSKDSRREAPEAGSLAITYVALVLICAGIGYLLDRLLETLPWLMVAGVFVGAGFGFLYLVFILFTTGRGRRLRMKKGEYEGSRPSQRSPESQVG